VETSNNNRAEERMAELTNWKGNRITRGEGGKGTGENGWRSRPVNPVTLEIRGTDGLGNRGDSGARHFRDDAN